MNILYLHGYKGKPNNERIEYLSNLGFHVVAPHIDYDNEPKILDKLLKEDFDYVIGNSMGGLLAYYISKINKVPSICVNPPLYMDLKGLYNVDLGLSDKTLNDYEDIRIVVGSEDSVVLPHKVIDWVRSNDPEIEVVKVIDMEHRYPQKTFIKFSEDKLQDWLSIDINSKPTT